ncbi:MAG TPA: c-type cytochrome domain-containing protein [Verrucomicrobiae bacterium]|jgi:hypothetical protein
MKFFLKNRFKPLAAGIFLCWLSGQVVSAIAQIAVPSPANIKIEFDRDIRPILETSCLRCHGPQKPKSHFRLDDRAAALAGGDENTNDIVPGDSAKSLLIQYVAGQVPDLEMPPVGKGDPLTSQQIGLLRAWIDQGASWSTTNQLPPMELVVAPTMRWFDVSGNKSQFRALTGTKEGFSEGVDKFSVTEQINPNEKVTFEGRALVPEQDYKFKLAVDRTDLGFIHVGFDQWRKYYNNNGGFDPAVVPSGFYSDRDLHVDDGRAWVDFGLELPNWPEIILGYEYQYRRGNESTLDWGNAGGKNIYPATQVVDERTHVIKLNVAKDIGSWHLENDARVEFYTEKNQGAEAGIVFPGDAAPDQFVNTHDDYHHVQGMDTLVIEKSVREGWFLSGGLYYSYLSGSDFFDQSTAFASPAFNFFNTNQLSSQQITLSRRSEMFSLANLFTPMEYLNISVGLQNEWTRESGFGLDVPDLEFGGTVPANSSLDEFKALQNASIRFTKIPFTVLFGDGQFSEDNYSVSQNLGGDEIARETAANNFRYDLKTGFNTSPWRWFELTAQYEHSDSDTDYNPQSDIFNNPFGASLSSPTNGYPAFILGRNIRSDQFETKIVLRPARWLKTTLTYQLSATDYSSKTDPAFDPLLPGLVSSGGFIADGRYDLQTYGISAVVTPFRQWYFSGAFTYSDSRVTTADNGDPSIVPYQGSIYTANVAATYAINEKTGLQLAYVFSSADYAENNAAAGIPAGLNYTHSDVIIGLTRKITKRLSGALHYEYSQYHEPSGGNVNDFHAQGIFAAFVYAWQ